MRKHHAFLAMAAALAIVVAALPAPARAKKSFLKAIAEHHKLNDALAKCTVCHEAGGDDAGEENLTAFGKDFRRALKKAPSTGGADKAVSALEAVADKDCDGDGATNIEEIMLGTNPADAKSKPDAEKLAEYRRTHAKK
jgi:hypothetical protein